jgi:hypothetical protein
VTSRIPHFLHNRLTSGCSSVEISLRYCSFPVFPHLTVVRHVTYININYMWRTLSRYTRLRVCEGISWQKIEQITIRGLILLPSPSVYSAKDPHLRSAFFYSWAVEFRNRTEHHRTCKKSTCMSNIGRLYTNLIACNLRRIYIANAPHNSEHYPSYFFYLKHDVSETEFCLHFHVESIQLGLINIISF